ncbi:MAG: hypothetical protein WAZ40_02475 [Minisyncoccia bacterium]
MTSRISTNKLIISTIVGVILVALFGRAIWAYRQVKSDEVKMANTQALIATTPPEPVQADAIIPTFPTVIASVPTSKSVANQVKSEIDKYGVDFYKLKQGIITIEKTVPITTKIVYTRSGNSVFSKATAPDGFVSSSGTELGSPTVPGSSGVDKYGTNLRELKEGETIMEKILDGKVQATYSRNGDKIEKKVKTTDIFGSSTLTAVVDLNSKESLLAEIKKRETRIVTDCKDTSTQECISGKTTLDYLKLKCTVLKTNEEISICMRDAVYGFSLGSF